jgi:two-component system response regulator HydG
MYLRVLVVDDDRATCSLIVRGLVAEGFSAEHALSAEGALSLARTFEPHVVVTDLNMGAMSGLALCERLTEQWPDVPVIVITAFGSLETAIAAIRAGAYDFVTKPFDLDALTLVIARAGRHHQLKTEVKRLRAAVGEVDWSRNLIGTSGPMMELRGLLERVAQADASVLITGESGTGKEVVARTLHEQGRRRERPFVAVNCAAVPEALIESELFGHVRGAFTDARTARAGLFAEANGGTLFLDEVGDLPLALQPKLLRALEERRARPVGGPAEIPFDVRVIAATHRDLETAIQEGRFREDLYYRLNVLHLELPPLRSRSADVLLLAQHFVKAFAARSGTGVRGLSADAAQKLLAYPWPGNVRELRNCIERAVALTRFDLIGVDDLPEKVKRYEAQHVLVASNDFDSLVSLEEVERRYILRVMQAAGGNKSIAARKLGLSRKTLYRKLADYGEE